MCVGELWNANHSWRTHPWFTIRTCSQAPKLVRKTQQHHTWRVGTIALSGGRRAWRRAPERDGMATDCGRRPPPPGSRRARLHPRPRLPLFAWCSTPTYYFLWLTPRCVVRPLFPCVAWTQAPRRARTMTTTTSLRVRPARPAARPPREPRPLLPGLTPLCVFFVRSCHHWRLRRRQVEPAEPLHAQRVPPRLEIDDRRRVRDSQHPARWQDHQGADLGHGWPGAVPCDH